MGEDYENQCSCADVRSDWCPVHALDTIPAPGYRELAEHEDDKHLVAEDTLTKWLALPEPRMRWEDFVYMTCEADEIPTSPDCPIAIHSSNAPPPSDP